MKHKDIKNHPHLAGFVTGECWGMLKIARNTLSDLINRTGLTVGEQNKVKKAYDLVEEIGRGIDKRMGLI